MNQSLDRSYITSVLSGSGLPACGVVGHSCLENLAMIAPPAEVARYGLLESSGAVVALLPYDPRPMASDHESPDDAASLSIGAFAAQNRYATLGRLLKQAGRALALCSGLPPRSFRVLVNSRLPEKRLAVMAGLGFIGRSSLVVTNAYGPACIIGALLLPPGFELVAEGTQERRDVDAPCGCGACSACADACPTCAIVTRSPAESDVRLDSCIQYWTTAPGNVPEEVRAVWGRRLYGCDVCVAACPHSTRAWTPGPYGQSPAAMADALATPEERRPGRIVPMADIDGASDEQIKALFKGTALGMSWIPPALLRRNAGIARRLSGIPN
ncbi:MAG TPA: 4Fe-4S double cluster binding domain-containing protein [bacterium]|nr:4Fe-4S double cluster binding domain-containing protein [bacterium]